MLWVSMIHNRQNSNTPTQTKTSNQESTIYFAKGASFLAIQNSLKSWAFGLTLEMLSSSRYLGVSQQGNFPHFFLVFFLKTFPRLISSDKNAGATHKGEKQCVHPPDLQIFLYQN